MAGKQNGVLIVGNFLSEHIGVRGVCEDLSNLLEGIGWRVFRTSNRLNRFARLNDILLTTWRERHAYRIAAVEVYSGSAFIWAEAVTWLLRQLGKPYILTLHGGNLPEFARAYPKRVQNLLRGAAAVTTPSHFIREAFLSIREDVLWLPNGISLERYPYQLPQSVPNLAWLRAFHSIYNPLMAVEVMRLIKADFPDAVLTMYGPDKRDGSLIAVQQAVQTADLDQNIRIYGLIDKSTVPNHLRQHSIFLNTTTAESFGVSPIEAAAVGLPLVTTNVGELARLWVDGEDAMLVASGDAQAMACAVCRILADQELAQQLSRNGRAKAEQFDWSAVIPQWDRLLKSIIQKSSIS